MNTKIFGGLMLVAVLAITSAAKADTVTYQQQHKKHRLEHRLKRDVRNGEITPEQAKHFRMEAKHIHEEKRMAMANGTFTPAERMHIHNEKKMLNRALHRDEHKA
jgi:hypothetical protein